MGFGETKSRLCGYKELSIVPVGSIVDIVDLPGGIFSHVFITVVLTAPFGSLRSSCPISNAGRNMAIREGRTICVGRIDANGRTL